MKDPYKVLFTDITNKYAKMFRLSQDESRRRLRWLANEIMKQMAQGKTVYFSGLFKAVPGYRSARNLVNPRDPSKMMTSPAMLIPRFYAGNRVKKFLKTIDPEAFTHLKNRKKRRKKK